MIKVLLAFSALFGIGAAALGFMTKGKVDSLKEDLSGTKSRLVDTQADLTKTQGTLKTAQESLATTTTELEAKKAEAVKLSADLNEATRKVEDLSVKMAEAAKQAEDAQTKITDLEKRIADAMGGPNVGGQDVNIAQKIDDLTKQRDAAEAEKVLLAEQLKAAIEQKQQLVVAEERRKGKVMAKGLTGRVLAVNPAWNFVVLNLGDRQGVVEGGEMIIRRGNEMVGRVKISSVEPSTSIGDIIMSSVPRGIQVQPGDLVVYAGGQ